MEVASEEEGGMSDIEFEPGVNFSGEENEKVARILDEMELKEKELEASKYVPTIPPGGERRRFPRHTPSGQVTIAKRLGMVPAVAVQPGKREVKKPEVKEEPTGPRVGGKKQPEVKKPRKENPGVNPEEKKKETWMQSAAAPPPPKKMPEQRQQVEGEKKKKGDGFTKVKRQQQKKEEMKPVPPRQNSMEKSRVTFKRDNGLLLSQKKDLDILSEVNTALFEAKVPYCVRIKEVRKNTRGYLTTITTPGATAEMLIRYREIVIKAAKKVDAGFVDIQTNELWERVMMHGVNFNRYLQKKTGGGLEKLGRSCRLRTRGWCCPLPSTGSEGQRMCRRRGKRRQHQQSCLQSMEVKWLIKF